MLLSLARHRSRVSSSTPAGRGIEGILFGAVLLLAGIVIAPCQKVLGATLIDVRVVMDGSNDPPGDKLNVRLLLLPKEPNITLEVRAFILSGDDKSTVTQVRARGQNNRDADGRFLATFVVNRPNVAEAVSFTAVIPYADLDIPVGTHELAYEIRGLREGQVEFVQPTALSLVTVSTQTRQEMEQRELITVRVPQTRIVTVVLGGERTRGSGPKPIERHEIKITETIPETATRLQKLAVNIPGVFRRTNIPKKSPDVSEPPPVPSRPLSDLRPPGERIIFFATNRGRVEGERDPALQFGKEPRNQVTWGECVVNIPVQHHRTGSLDTPGWRKQLDPEEHFLIESLRVLNREQVRSQIQDSDVLVFVHGYKTTFDRAVLRTAQLHYDLEFPGRAVAFSWPSTGDLTGYLRDAEQAESSADALATVLQELIAGRKEATQSGRPRKLHVIAHSMGNRVVLGALDRLSQKKLLPTDSKPLGQVILAAPDVNQELFNQLVPAVIDAAEQTTLYYCQKDLALVASRRFNKSIPVGLAPFFQDGLDTICADHASTDMTGLRHGYFAESNLVLLDMKLMLQQSLQPSNRRPPLAEPTLLSDRRHWSFVPTKLAND